MQVAILTLDGFNELDSFIAAAIINRMRPHGWAAHITSPTTTVTSVNGVTVKSQRPLKFVREADAVLIGSGFRSLDMLQCEGFGTEREQRLIAGALQSAERARTLVQRLLAFARRQPLQPRAVDVGQLVHRMTNLIASTSGPQTRVVVDVDPDVPAAMADQNQIEMALLNLSVNARDAMPAGGRLSIMVRETEVGTANPANLAPGRYVRLSVADTGVGMDEETLRRAIEPFYSTKGIGKGTGLGLSMVHGLAAQLGGGLTIESRPGLGTNVRLWLPVTEATTEDAHQVAPPVVVVGAGCVLLVDDEDMVSPVTIRST